MGEKLKAIFDYVEKEAGKIAVLRVTLDSRIPKSSAEIMNDTDDNINKVKEAAKKVLNKENIHI